jgi:galactokinase
MLDVPNLAREFTRKFGSPPRLFRAPGRVNLIGEHTDYMEGLCLPIAVDREVLVAAAPRDDGTLCIASKAFGTETVGLRDISPGATRAWHEPVRGIAAVLGRMDIALCGANLLIDSDVPVGGGLSSSAAVLVACGQAMLALSGHRLSPLELSLAVQSAEHEFAGTRSGLLDPLAVTSAARHHAVLIDCRTRQTSLVPFDEDAAEVLVFDTRTKHSLSESAYNDRRAECEAALLAIQRLMPGVRTLRDMSSDTLAGFAESVEPVGLSRVRHVVSENQRVVSAVRALRARDMDAFGRLMFDSHRSLRGDFEVSTAELDWVVDEAKASGKVLGAKMTGGGFGGCVVMLVEAGSRGAVAERLLRGYQRRFGSAGEAYGVVATDGAGELEVPG